MPSNQPATPSDRWTGHLRVADELRPLPVGSTLDDELGTFSWQAGPGFLGRFDLVFIRTDGADRREQLPVRVILRPQYAPPDPS